MLKTQADGQRDRQRARRGMTDFVNLEYLIKAASTHINVGGTTADL